MTGPKAKMWSHATPFIVLFVCRGIIGFSIPLCRLNAYDAELPVPTYFLSIKHCFVRGFNFHGRELSAKLFLD